MPAESILPPRTEQETLTGTASSSKAPASTPVTILDHLSGMFMPESIHERPGDFVSDQNRRAGLS